MPSSNFYKRTTSTSVESSSENDSVAGGVAQLCSALMFLIGIGSATLLILNEKGWWSVMILVATVLFCTFMTEDKEEPKKEVKVEEPQGEDS